jgi:hypothetical protein
MVIVMGKGYTVEELQRRCALKINIDIFKLDAKKLAEEAKVYAIEKNELSREEYAIEAKRRALENKSIEINNRLETLAENLELAREEKKHIKRHKGTNTVYGCE